ncbi:MAG: hypothetical protein NWP37_02495, partial [Pontimonas sp.]|nr:hypothetical protein [Pontimonas sp.]
MNGVGWEEAKRSYPDVRRLLQNLGTEAIRALDPGFWVRIAMKKALEADGPVVFIDTRFPNEIDAIRRQGGILVRVERPGCGAPGRTRTCDLRFRNTSTPSGAGGRDERSGRSEGGEHDR